MNPAPKNTNNKNQKPIFPKLPKKDAPRPKRTVLSQAVVAFVIFIFLISAYSLISGRSQSLEEVSLL